VIVHVRFGEAPLEPMPADDPNHRGEFSSRYATVYESADRVVQAGFEELSGDITAAPADGFEEIVVVLEGTAEIECSGVTHRVRPGDVIVQEHPIGVKRLRTEGLKTAYVIRYRR
jgi:quercetin dioxygenase-like cupin family protein